MLANFRCGVTTSISEVGAETLTQAGLPTIATEKRSCDAEILEEAIPLQGQLLKRDSVVNFLLQVIRSGNAISTAASGRDVILPSGAVEASKYAWKLQSLWLLLKILLRPKCLTGTQSKCDRCFPRLVTHSVNQVTGDIGFTSQ